MLAPSVRIVFRFESWDTLCKVSPEQTQGARQEGEDTDKGVTTSGSMEGGPAPSSVLLWSLCMPQSHSDLS
jgi:hypothetical protein